MRGSFSLSTFVLDSAEAPVIVDAHDNSKIALREALFITVSFLREREQTSIYCQFSCSRAMLFIPLPLEVPMSESPLTELTDLETGQRRIFAKHEYLGATGSIKDRMVGGVLSMAIAEGSLSEGMEIVEASSGNTGAALAAAGAHLGFAVRIFVSSLISVEKTAMIEALGAKVERIDVSLGRSEIEMANSYAHDTEAYFFNQFENPHHLQAYKVTLAQELLAQLESQGIKVDHFVGGVGTGAGIRAVGEILRERHNPELKIWATVPAVSPTDIEGLHPGHLRKEGYFRIWRERLPGFESAIEHVADEDAYRRIFELERLSGIKVGPASGAYLHVASKLDGVVLVLFTDTGDKYTNKKAAWRERLDWKS